MPLDRAFGTLIGRGSPCPCGLGLTYGGCCGRFHAGADAPTAELLMRSRYSAFAVGDADYLIRTWHPSARPAQLVLDPDQEWLGLEVLATTGGGMFATEGTVEFVARYRKGRDVRSLHDVSAFARHDGRWRYVGEVRGRDGEPDQRPSPARGLARNLFPSVRDRANNEPMSVPKARSSGMKGPLWWKG